MTLVQEFLSSSTTTTTTPPGLNPPFTSPCDPALNRAVFLLCRERKDSEQERRLVRRPFEEKAAAAAENPLYQPAAAGTGGHFPAESLPGHEHAGGDRRVDQPHRGPGQGECRVPRDSSKKRLSCLTFFLGLLLFLSCVTIFKLKVFAAFESLHIDGKFFFKQNWTYSRENESASCLSGK